MRIGILGHGFIDWSGGLDFLRTVVSSLHHSGRVTELHALVPTRGPRLSTMRALRHTIRGAKMIIGRTRVVQTRADTDLLADLVNSAERPVELHEIDIGTSAIARTARKLSLDALVPAFAPLPPDFPTPWVGYLYDFQHRYLPQFFTAADRAQRDRHFSAMLANARAVIVNARTVAADVARFHPEGHARVFALPFSASAQPSWLTHGKFSAPQFGIERPYFIICNQFWKHKDHGTAFSAFAQIAGSYPDVDLVCTGATGDYRDPEHFPALQSALDRDGISHRVHIVGVVPKADQIALVKGSIALIQPTLFEGGPGGGAVFDAVSVGVRCIVSDIPVNRELAEPGVSFFPSGDSSTLAALLITAIERGCTLDGDAQVLLQRGHARRAACGMQILNAIEYARTRG